VRKIIFICILYLLVSFPAYCQILDDSTKLIYSAKTTQYFTFGDVLYNTNRKTSIDTSLINLHNYNYYFKNGILYQDLGNFGTPLNRIYYEVPNSIGKKLGFTTMNEYGYDPDKLEYFDTKSPYTKVMYVQGALGQQMLEAQHTQNIKPYWNVGFSIKRMVAIKQIGVSGVKEQQMTHYSFNTHSSYFSKNKRYTFLFSFTHLDHVEYENGGILPDSGATKADLFHYKLETPQLYSRPNGRTVPTHLRSYQKTSNFRFFNQYNITKGKGLQVFHQFDYSTAFIRYDDDYLYNLVPSEQNAGYYPNLYFDTISTHDRIAYELYENKAGIKGSAIKEKLFYLAYARRRDFGYSQTNYQTFQRNVHRYHENFIGGQAEYRITDTMALSAKAEYYIGRDYLFDFNFRSKFLDAGYTSISYSPTLFQLSNVSNSYIWQNDFSNTYANSARIAAKVNAGRLFISPFAEYTNVYQMIYYNSQALPQQSNGLVNMTSVGLSGKFTYKIFCAEEYIRYTNIGGADVWRAPALFNMTRLYVYGPLFRHALRLQLGVEAFWKSGYYGNAYSPATQQYYLSDRSNSFNYLDSYLLTNVFLNTQIKRGFVFLKFSHINQGIAQPPGYFITPYYTALPRSFEFGVRWLFYD